MTWLLLGCADPVSDGYWVMLSGRVVDESGEGIGGAQVQLGTEDGVVTASTAADPDGAWRTPVFGTAELGNVVIALYDAPGRTQGLARYVINLRSPEVTSVDPGPWQTWQASERRLPTMMLADDVQTGSVEGSLVDALGEAVPDTTVTFTRGWNTEASPTLSLVTDAAGAFELTGTPGWWTATAAATTTHGGARFGVFVDTVEGGVSPPATVAPAASAWLVASLSWAARPLDLDLHVTSPLRGGQAGEDGSGVFHVWSNNPRHPVSDVVEAEAELVRSDSDGVGPETIIVADPPDSGETHVAVFDNDNRSDPASLQLGLGQAMVQLWLDGVPSFHTVSPGDVGTLWRPVELDDAQVYAVEAMVSGVDPADGSAI